MIKDDGDNKMTQFDITNFTRYKPSTLGAIALNKKKATKLKMKIRKEAGVPKAYWDHTKNYSKEQKKREQSYVKDRVNKHNIETFLSHYRKKPSFNTYLKKIVKEFTKKTPITSKNRHNVPLYVTSSCGLSSLGLQLT